MAGTALAQPRGIHRAGFSCGAFAGGIGQRGAGGPQGAGGGVVEGAEHADDVAQRQVRLVPFRDRAQRLPFKVQDQPALGAVGLRVQQLAQMQVTVDALQRRQVLNGAQPVDDAGNVGFIGSDDGCGLIPGPPDPAHHCLDAGFALQGRWGVAAHAGQQAAVHVGRGPADRGGLFGEVESFNGRGRCEGPDVLAAGDEFVHDAQVPLQLLAGFHPAGRGPAVQGRHVAAAGLRQGSAYLHIRVDAGGQHAEELDDDGKPADRHHHRGVGLLTAEHPGLAGGRRFPGSAEGVAAAGAGRRIREGRAAGQEVQPAAYEGGVVGSVVDPAGAQIGVLALAQQCVTGVLQGLRAEA